MILTLAGYKAMYSVSTDTNDAQLTALLPSIEDFIIRYLGYNPFLTTYSEVYNGTGNNFIRLKSKPIVSISSIVFDPYATNPTTITGSNFIFDNNSIVYFSPSYVQVPAYFPQGKLNIQVNYTAGYSLANIPASIKQAIALMVDRTIKQSSPNTVVNSESLGDYSISYGKNWFDLNQQQWLDVQRILDTGFKPIKFIF